jgi:hypothetical protein
MKGMCLIWVIIFFTPICLGHSGAIIFGLFFHQCIYLYNRLSSTGGFIKWQRLDTASLYSQTTMQWYFVFSAYIIAILLIIIYILKIHLRSGATDCMQLTCEWFKWLGYMNWFPSLKMAEHANNCHLQSSRGDCKQVGFRGKWHKNIFPPDLMRKWTQSATFDVGSLPGGHCPHSRKRVGLCLWLWTVWSYDGRRAVIAAAA